MNSKIAAGFLITILLIANASIPAMAQLPQVWCCRLNLICCDVYGRRVERNPSAPVATAAGNLNNSPQENLVSSFFIILYVVTWFTSIAVTVCN